MSSEPASSPAPLMASISPLLQPMCLAAPSGVLAAFCVLADAGVTTGAGLGGLESALGGKIGFVAPALS